MTGFASTLFSGTGTEPSVSVEIRSVNSRFLDLSFKLGEELRGLEHGMRELLSARLRRGKVELRVAVRTAAAPEPVEAVSDSALERLAVVQDAIRRHLPEAPPLSVHEAMQWCRPSVAASMPVSEDVAMKAVAMCLAALQEARRREGGKLKAALLERVERLRTLVSQAGPMVPAVIERQRARFLERWQEALQLAATSATASALVPDATSARDRALQEATALAIRIDVSEELARLTAHLDEIERLLDIGGELGKRLDFLTQELHREANTLGSKSAALELSTVSMEMKVLIEQMREQVQNIE